MCNYRSFIFFCRNYDALFCHWYDSTIKEKVKAKSPNIEKGLNTSSYIHILITRSIQKYKKIMENITDKDNKNILISFSGGRTSAFMSKYMKERYSKTHNLLFVFANTGKEKEETLKFVDKCDREFSLNLVWVEALVNPEKGKGTKHKIVNYQTASRNGEPFEEVIKKYGLPTKMGGHCTRELKTAPIHSYIKSLNIKDYKTAIGIRHDERHRKNENGSFLYPLCDEIKVDSVFIRNWWDSQKFDLELKDYEGNCDLCFKKSLRKRMTILKEYPFISEWWEDMENKYQNEIIDKFDIHNKIKVSEILTKSKSKFNTYKDNHFNNQKKMFFDDDFECFCKI